MRINIWFLITGVLSVLFCFTHAWNGTAAVLPLLDGSDINLTMKTVYFYVWHIISAENLVFGAAFIVMAFYRDAVKVRSAAWLIAALIMCRWFVIAGSTLMKNFSELGATAVDTAAIAVYISLILLGIRKINRDSAKS